jgi:AraC-like DNA-binding protein
MDAAASGTSVRAWKPDIAGIREVLHAHFTDHVYPPHTHDAWTLFIVDDGAIRYDLGRHARGAEPSMVSVLPPFVAHDGRPARGGGYRKRVIYLEPEVLGEDLIGPVVDAPAATDPALRRQVARLHRALTEPDDRLEAETRLAFLAERIRARYVVPGAAPESEPTSDLAEAFRAWLDERVFESVSIADAAVALGAGPTQLARAFAATFGIPPHAYLLGRRLDAARDRILDGRPLADVAAEVGFFDQAHLTRRFKRFLGVTPGRFANGNADATSLRGVTLDGHPNEP